MSDVPPKYDIFYTLNLKFCVFSNDLVYLICVCCFYRIISLGIFLGRLLFFCSFGHVQDHLLAVV